MRTEFSHDGRFSFEGFEDKDCFLVLGQPCANNALPTPNQNIVIPPPGSIPSILPTFSPRRRILFTVKVVRGDIDLQTGKPVNVLKYNRVVTVPIYNKNEACVSHIVQ